MDKILIANRGEIACRVIKSCKRLGLGTVAVYSSADEDALHVELADEAREIGPAPARESYLVGDRILAAATSSGARAIHPGYGFLAENSGFATSVRKAGLLWIGPDPQTIEKMGDKERARSIAIKSGIPVLPGSRRFAEGNLEGLQKAADGVGYPLLVKSAAGGGGIGMKLLNDPNGLHDAAVSTQAMASKAFGDGTIYLERFIPRARHVEVQVFGFGDGHAVHLYERDCSLQRRFQKVVEESPAPRLPEPVRRRMAAAATKLAKDIRYSGAGTIEFIVDAESSEFFFLEMNTRIQVEHPVTEMCTGSDLIAMQIELARGVLEPIKQQDIEHTGHSIECRVYAEKPEKNFMPSPGTLNAFEVPRLGSKVRLDTGMRAGDTVTPFYDPMIAKVICCADTRSEALEIMDETLAQFEIDGVANNVAFLQKVLENDAFRNGDVYTGFIGDNIASLIN